MVGRCDAQAGILFPERYIQRKAPGRETGMKIAEVCGTGVAAAHRWSLSPVAFSAAVKAARSRGGCVARCGGAHEGEGWSAIIFYVQ